MAISLETAELIGAHGEGVLLG
jgi:hypothetical protein